MKRMIALFCIGTSLMFGCSSDEEAPGEQSGNIEFSEPSDEMGATPAEISIVPISNSVEFPEATIAMSTSEADADSTAFAFNVEGYELGAQTEGPHKDLLANSAGGQHIHLIVDNGPYSAHYKPMATKMLGEGHHTVLAFLSRSYHESVKNAASFAVENITVGEVAGENPADLSAPHMFYSRPKGTYSKVDGENLMLDFFLVNCDLAPDGYTVKATINESEFVIDKWTPYVINGLTPGTTTVTLELFDANGVSVASPFNPVTREVTIEE